MTTHRTATPPRPGGDGGGATVAGTAPAGCPLMSRVFEMVMEPTAVHVAQARRTTATVLRGWSLPDAPAENARLVVSELVTNAITHGSGDVRLRLWHDNHELRIWVTDDSTAPARRRRAGVSDHGGRGLHLVERMSLRWGVADSGRTTYAVIPTLTEAPRCRRTTRPSSDPTC
ncbi:ATP-binding protein [Streptomyces sp. 110]|uniref:ATP-binding protein n=1 Tax=Streptomyces endocoffeicus TaxID=2898945 RepID=A0ABS1Q1N6_9ACTN|nr:ATP-binding protein [Streptomyces endocoffeicus]MBL1118239.1 ATP-binding protein [Streptomyces endocoffeicus]